MLEALSRLRALATGTADSDALTGRRPEGRIPGAVTRACTASLSLRPSFALAAIVSALAGCPRPGPRQDAPVERIPLPPIDCAARDSVSLHLVLPDAEAARRSWYVDQVFGARATVALFASVHGWSALAARCPFTDLEVVPDVASLAARAQALGGAAPTDGVPAVIAGGVLLAVTPTGYVADNPAYAAPRDAWMRLVAFALARALHASIVAEAAAPSAGPAWFATGFAGLASGQDLDAALALAYPDAATSLAATSPAPESTAAARCTAAARYFARRVPLRALVVRVTESDFDAALAGD